MDDVRDGAVSTITDAPYARVDVVIADIDFRRAIRLAVILMSCALEVEVRLTGLETFDVLNSLLYGPAVLVAAAELLDGPFLHRLAMRFAGSQACPRLLIMAPNGWGDAGQHTTFLRTRNAELFSYPVDPAELAAKVLGSFTPPFYISPSLSVPPTSRESQRWLARTKSSHFVHVNIVRALLKRGSRHSTRSLRGRPSDGGPQSDE